MIVCLCNPFSDKQINAHLTANADKKAKVSEIYSICSDGQSPQCCSCLETIKDMVKAHNRKVVPIAAE